MNTKQTQRLASLEIELQRLYAELRELELRLSSQKQFGRTTKDQVVLYALLRATAQLLHAYSHPMAGAPEDFSVRRVFDELGGCSPQSAETLDEASQILCRIAAITSALIQEHGKRFRSGTRRRSSLLPGVPDGQEQTSSPRPASVRPIKRNS